MCGIFGQWNRDGAPVDLLRVERAASLIRHRGPDDEGYLLVNVRAGAHVLCGGRDTTASLELPAIDTFRGQHFDLAFAFRRLSILDLSPAGHQPMASVDGRRWIVFNGEVYNFVELRSELEALGHRFRSQTDTEVVLAAYTQWRDAAIQRLRGMFAFALWDGEARRLLLARDRFGIKPLFLMERGSSLLFGSELKTFGAVTGESYAPNAGAVAAFVSAARMPNALEGETFFRGISSLPAAHYAVFTPDRKQIDRYWRIPAPQATTQTAEQAVREYRAMFQDAVRVHLRSDVPVGTCLSGGLDSGSIVAVAADLRRASTTAAPMDVFSAIYADPGPWNERAYIEQLVTRTGARPHYVEPFSDGLFRDLPELIWHQEEPFPTTSNFAQWCVMREARRAGVPVLLDGQGADELLGGYHSFYGDYLRDTLFSRGLLAALVSARQINGVAGAVGSKSLLREAARAMSSVVPGLPSWVQRRRLERWTSEAALRERPPADLVASWVAPADRGFAATLRRAAEEAPLPHLLRFEDRNSMAFSVEARVPFLDHPLVEFVSADAHPFRLRDGWTKWLHRSAFSGVLPAEIAWRRDKVGFATPEPRWLAEGARQVREAFATGRAVDELLDTLAIRRRLEDPPFVARNGGIVWRWLCVAAWADVFFCARAFTRRIEAAATTSAPHRPAAARA